MRMAYRFIILIKCSTLSPAKQGMIADMKPWSISSESDQAATNGVPSRTSWRAMAS